MSIDNVHETDRAAQIRNIGIIAHIDAGKTTLTERILYVTDAISRMGEVHEGTTVTDWMEQERQRGISINAACVHCDWRGCHVNVVDTPGHVDFTAEVERSLCVMDGVVVIFCGVKGVQAQSENVWRRSQRYKLPVIAFINKMDREGADGLRVLEQIRQRFQVSAMPVEYPVYDPDGNFTGVLDLTEPLESVQLSRLSSVESQVEALEWREQLLEKLSESSDVVLGDLLAGKTPDTIDVRRALRSAVVNRRVVAVYFGSSLKNIGVSSLMDGICRYMPSPLEHRGSHVAAEAGVTLLVFRVTDSPDGDGRLAYVRVLGGMIRPGQVLTNVRNHFREAVVAVWRMQAQDVEVLESASSGDIVALKGSWRRSRTGDVLSEHELSVRIARMRFPQPVMSVNFSCIDGNGDLGGALKQLSREDPTLHVHELYSGEVWSVSGMGELHVEIVRDRLCSDFGIHARISEPRVEYRRTIRHPVVQRQVFEKRFPNGQVTACVELELQPLERGKGLQVDHGGMTSSPELQERVKEGIMNVVNGETGGFPLTDMKVTILQASAEGSVDAWGAALVTASRAALESALFEGGDVTLEPVMLLEIHAPEDVLGSVIADLRTRHGEVTQVESEGDGFARILAKAPLAELFGYASSLRSLSAGRGEVVAEPMAYGEKGTLH